MVGWYDPGQLARTAIQVAISTIFGRNSDRRLFESLAKKEPAGRNAGPDLDVSETKGDDFWFDYIADVGDGFNSTYTMAYYLTEPTLPLGGENTKPGQILIFGGDEVYPVANKPSYEQKLIGPYETAFPRPKPNADAPPLPHVFAIPGNHDWYDSLVEFSFNFLEKHFGATRFFGGTGWKLAQQRSYFAIKLPHGWWLLGTDMQLGSALDTPQMEFFDQIMKAHVKPDDKIILCHAEPNWITRAMYPDLPEFDNRNIGFFEGQILKRRTNIFVAGDRHYYRRHEERSDGPKENATDCTAKRQRIVAGGGGAFLHPTHKEAVDTVGSQPVYELKKSFPEPSESWMLGLRNLFFIVWNWKFGLLTGGLYVLTARSFLSTYLGKYDFRDLYEALYAAAHGTLTETFSLFWVIAIFGGFFLFTDTTSKIYRFVGGFLHGLAHLTGVFLVSWQVSRFIDPTKPPVNWTIGQLLLGGLLVFIGGFLIGPIIMGIYLFISLNIFGRHHNEAFSALKIEGYKNFLRFKIRENGDLTIYPVGVKKVIKRWRPNSTGRLVPHKKRKENDAFLIEGPICFSKAREHSAEQRS